jgi:hypothetical protein
VDEIESYLGVADNMMVPEGRSWTAKSRKDVTKPQKGSLSRQKDEERGRVKLDTAVAFFEYEINT